MLTRHNSNAGKNNSKLRKGLVPRDWYKITDYVSPLKAFTDNLQTQLGHGHDIRAIEIIEKKGGVVFVPAREQNARRVITNCLLKERDVFTLGSKNGPLMLVRPGDGDPAVAPCDVPILKLKVETIEWWGLLRRELVRIFPPEKVLSDFLVQQRGDYGVPPLVGFASVPAIDDKGAIDFGNGYDPYTGIYHHNVAPFNVPSKPTKDDAITAMDVLLYPWSEYTLEGGELAKAVLLATVFTALRRPFLDRAPACTVASPQSGTGKGEFVNSLSLLAFGEVPKGTTFGSTAEEFDKRIFSSLRSAPRALLIDNVNNKNLQNDTLESFITEGKVSVRILGVSEDAEIASRTLLLATGNNMAIAGDMARRVLSTTILPRSNDPEADVYQFTPTEYTRANRTKLLNAAYTIMRAYRLAGMPAGPHTGAGSFGQWVREVRDMVFWMTGIDVTAVFRRNKENDPARQDDTELVRSLARYFGDRLFRATDVMEVYNIPPATPEMLAMPLKGALSDIGKATSAFQSITLLNSLASNPNNGTSDQALCDAYQLVLTDLINAKNKLKAVKGSLDAKQLHNAIDEAMQEKTINAKSIGWRARKLNGVRLRNLVLEMTYDAHAKANRYVVKKLN
jgi:hypothetical protein